MSEEQVYISPWEHPEFFDGNGYPLEKYRYLFDWKLDYATRDRLMREALAPLRAEQYQLYESYHQEYLKDYADALKQLSKSPNVLEQERAAAQQRELEDKQKAEIDAYNAAERERLAGVYAAESPAYLSWFQRASDEIAALPTTTPAAPPAAADVAAEAARQAAALNTIAQARQAEAERSRQAIDQDLAAAARSGMLETLALAERDRAVEIASAGVAAAARSRTLNDVLAEILDLINLRRKP